MPPISQPRSTGLELDRRANPVPLAPSPSPFALSPPRCGSGRKPTPAAAFLPQSMFLVRPEKPIPRPGPATPLRDGQADGSSAGCGWPGCEGAWLFGAMRVSGPAAVSANWTRLTERRDARCRSGCFLPSCPPPAGQWRASPKGCPLSARGIVTEGGDAASRLRSAPPARARSGAAGRARAAYPRIAPDSYRQT